MRRLVVMMCALGLLAPLAAPATGAGQTRKDSEIYDATPQSGQGGITFGSDELWVYFGDGVRFDTKPGEKYVTLTIIDDSGEDVAAVAWQKDHDVTTFCASSDRIPITGGKPLFVHPVMDMSPGASACPSQAPTTTGKIGAKFR